MVSDDDATRFAAKLYRELSHKDSLEHAFALARAELFLDLENNQPLAVKTDYESQDWHLARLYLGPEGGGPIATGSQSSHQLEKDFGTKDFLGK